jgi:hypothetical protein
MYSQSRMLTTPYIKVFLFLTEFYSTRGGSWSLRLWLLVKQVQKGVKLLILESHKFQLKNQIETQVQSLKI